MFKIYDGRTEFWQWDLDRKIIVSDPVIDEVHFCNKTDNCSLVVEVYELNGQRVANVPNILLQNAWPINVFGYCGKCFTKQYAKFKVNARSKPADYVYTETEIKSYEDLKVRVEAVEEGVKAKLDKDLSVLSNSFTNYLYAKQADGRNFLVAIGGNAAPYSIPQRTATGTLRGATPVNEADLTPKKYVDDELDTKLDKAIPAAVNKVYICKANTGETLMESVARYTPVPAAIAQYDATSEGWYQDNGTLAEGSVGAVKTGIPQKPSHAVPKQYFEEALAKKVNTPDGIPGNKCVIGYNQGSAVVRTFTMGAYTQGNGHRGSIAIYDPYNGCLKSPTPITDTDVATKGYVDTAVANAGGGGGTKLYLHKFRGTFATEEAFEGWFYSTIGTKIMGGLNISGEENAQSIVGNVRYWVDGMETMVDYFPSGVYFNPPDVEDTFEEEVD